MASVELQASTRAVKAATDFVSARLMEQVASPLDLGIGRILHLSPLERRERFILNIGLTGGG
jgi:hypothetical protein